MIRWLVVAIIVHVLVISAAAWPWNAQPTYAQSVVYKYYADPFATINSDLRELDDVLLSYRVSQAVLLETMLLLEPSTSRPVDTAGKQLALRIYEYCHEQEYPELAKLPDQMRRIVLGATCLAYDQTRRVQELEAQIRRLSASCPVPKEKRHDYARADS